MTLRSYSFGGWFFTVAVFVTAPNASAESAREEPVAVSEQTALTLNRSALAVRITVQDSALQEADILKALANELSMPIVRGEGELGLRLQVNARALRASYRDDGGQVIERVLELPQDPGKQVETIALLSGNLARDEGGEILAQLRADADESATMPANVAPANVVPNATESDENSKESAQEGAEGAPPPQEPTASVEERAAPRNEGARPASERQELPVEDLSLALWGDVTWPKALDQKKTHVHFGAVHSRFGSLEGFAANLLTLHNLGRGKNYAGEGAQMAIIWAGSDGYFRGFHGSALAATAQGGIEGVQAAGIFSFQKNETLGAQLGGIGSVSMSHIEGVQGGGVFAGTWGDIRGVQAAGTVALVLGDVNGLQLSGGVSIVEKKMDGFQLGMANWAGELDGFQLSLLNVAHARMDGFQLALANYAGDLDGVQIGLLNVGGDVDGAQIGLINIAKDVDGVAFAPINIIPGIRNQVVTYGSWAPISAHEAAPVGPMAHVGFKFMPDPFYTLLSFGIAAEAEECPGGLLPGDAQCVGNGVLYAPGFAAGARARVVGDLFMEMDVQYQYEKAFSSSEAHRHAVLGRASLGYEFTEQFSFFVGGGPRMDVRVQGDGTVVPLPEWNPHVFAGVQVF